MSSSPNPLADLIAPASTCSLTRRERDLLGASLRQCLIAGLFAADATPLEITSLPLAAVEPVVHEAVAAMRAACPRLSAGSVIGESVPASCWAAAVVAFEARRTAVQYQDVGWAPRHAPVGSLALQGILPSRSSLADVAAVANTPVGTWLDLQVRISLEGILTHCSLASDGLLDDG